MSSGSVRIGQPRAGLDAALGERPQRFGTTRREVGLAQPPAPALLRPARRHLVEGETLEDTEAALAQPRVEPDVQTMRARERLRGLARARQVARVDRIQALVRERGREALGLPASHRIECDVQLALQAQLGVPGRLSVTDGDDARRLAGVRVVRRERRQHVSRAAAG